MNTICQNTAFGHVFKDTNILGVNSVQTIARSTELLNNFAIHNEDVNFGAINIKHDKQTQIVWFFPHPQNTSNVIDIINKELVEHGFLNIPCKYISKHKINHINVPAFISKYPSINWFIAVQTANDVINNPSGYLHQGIVIGRGLAVNSAINYSNYDTNTHDLRHVAVSLDVATQDQRRFNQDKHGTITQKIETGKSLSICQHCVTHRIPLSEPVVYWLLHRTAFLMEVTNLSEKCQSQTHANAPDLNYLQSNLHKIAKQQLAFHNPQINRLPPNHFRYPSNGIPLQIQDNINRNDIQAQQFTTSLLSVPHINGDIPLMSNRKIYDKARSQGSGAKMKQAKSQLDKQWTCLHCNRLFKKKSELSTHLNNKHPLLETYECKKCYKQFKSEEQYCAHVNKKQCLSKHIHN